MLTIKQFKGQRAESDVLRHLQSHGLQLIEKNYTCKQGEIDLIMREDDTLVFIEVRFRQKSDYGNSIESIGLYKQNRIIQSAEYYLQRHQLYDQVDCRFDVVGLDTSKQITWIKDAFQVEY